ncbi:MAG: hypothetical protein ACKO7N_04745, partial [Candidatus Nitrosotenuis sp.]
IPVVITDSDANKNSRSDEDLDFYNPEVTLIPALKIGNPTTLLGNGTAKPTLSYNTGAAYFNLASTGVEKYSDRAVFSKGTTTVVSGGDNFEVSMANVGLVNKTIPFDNTNFKGFGLLNYDIRSLENSGELAISTVNVQMKADSNGYQTIATNVKTQGLLNITKAVYADAMSGTNANERVYVKFVITGAGGTIPANAKLPIAVDFFGFGYINDGIKVNERVSNQIIRIEAEETGDNTGVFNGSLEYVMLNQLNILDVNTYTGLTTFGNTPSFVVIDDLDGNDAPRVNYNDLGADGVTTQVSDQVDTPTHSGIVSFDKSNYKIADTVTITLEDADLNTDVDLIDIYTTVGTGTYRDIVGSGGNTAYPASTQVLSNGDYLGRLLDITFDDEQWKKSSCMVGPAPSADDGLSETGFTLVETGSATGIFTGDYQVPTNYCSTNANPDTQTSTTGKDMEVNYVDFRDASGNIVEVGDGAGIRANTGSV